MPSTFVAFVARRTDRRIAVLSTATGAVVRYLTSRPAHLVYPELSADGRSVLFASPVADCKWDIRGVPITGGASTTVVAGAYGRLGAVSRYRDLLGYSRGRCDGPTPDPRLVGYPRTNWDVVVQNGGGPVVLQAGTASDRPAVADLEAGPRYVAFVDVADDTIRVADATTDVPVYLINPPTGCHWGANLAWQQGHLVAVASCQDRTRLYAMAADGTNQYLLADLGSFSVSTLDSSADGHLLLSDSLYNVFVLSKGRPVKLRVPAEYVEWPTW